MFHLYFVKFNFFYQIQNQKLTNALKGIATFNSSNELKYETILINSVRPIWASQIMKNVLGYLISRFINEDISPLILFSGQIEEFCSDHIDIVEDEVVHCLLPVSPSKQHKTRRNMPRTVPLSRHMSLSPLSFSLSLSIYLSISASIYLSIYLSSFFCISYLCLYSNLNLFLFFYLSFHLFLYYFLCIVIV